VVRKSRCIRTSWASLSLTEQRQAIVCVKGNGSSHCLWFESLEELAGALARKTLVVRKWAVTAPRELCILKSVSLPAADLDEAARMVEFELPSLVPLSAEEVVYGCTVAGRQENLLRVLVYIIKADALERHLQTYKSAGIEPRRVSPDILAMHAWFLSVCRHLQGPTVFVWAGTSACHLMMSDEENFQGSQVLPLGADTAANAREIAREVMDRGRRLTASVPEPIRVVLAGPPELVSCVEGHLHASEDPNVRVEVTVVPRPCVRLPGAQEEQPDGAGEAVLAAGLLELSLGAPQPLTNLVPRGYLAKEQQHLLLVNALRVGILSVLLVALLWGCLAAANRRLAKACATVQAQIAPIVKVAGGVDRKRQRLRVIQRQLANRGRIAEAIAELYECTPKDISISALDVTWKQDTMTIDIKGHADLLPTAFEYTNAVREARLLRAMQIVDAQQIPKAAGGSVVEFKARCSVEEDASGKKR
jgi:hypothetical protein